MKERTDETVHRFSCVCENHKWLSLMDSNHLNKNQNLAYYHYTKGQDNGSPSGDRTRKFHLEGVATITNLSIGPFYLRTLKMVEVVGFEPTKFCLQSRRYRPLTRYPR